jgi:dipeptidyl-peptidase-3
MWGQAHIWAAWVIFATVREGDPDLIKIEFSKTAEGKDWFTMHVDRSRLRTFGFKALDEFLHKLHVYKSIGDFETAEKFF